MASQSGSSVFFDADFSLASGNNIGSIIYDFHRRDAKGKLEE